MRARRMAAVLALAACARTEAPDPAALIAIGPGDVRLEPAPVARSVSGRLLPPVPHVPGVAPILNGQPARLRFGFDGDRLPPEVNPLQRQVLVYPLAAYRALFPAGERIVLDERVTALRRVLAERPEFMDTEEIPVLPEPVDSQAFRARIRYLRFDGGAGVAFITRYAGGKAPSRNPLVWTFQGLTDDGRYWVSIYHPIDASGLPDSAVPEVTVHYLDALRDDGFRPGLDALAGLARTLTVREPPPPEGEGGAGSQAS